MNAAQRARKRWKREKREKLASQEADDAPDFKPRAHVLWMPTKESAATVAGWLRTHAAKGSTSQTGDRVVSVENIPSFEEGALQWKVTATATSIELLDPMTFEAFEHLAKSNGGEYGGVIE